MRKVKCLILVFLVLFSVVVFSSCKNYSNYKEMEGYTEYISDCNAGNDIVPYFNVQDSMSENVAARKYFSENSRRCGDFIITDYMDGVCINRYCGILFGDDLIIPEKLDGKPVVKLGGYFEGDVQDEDYKSKDINGAFSGCGSINLHIPSTVKVITNMAVFDDFGILSDDEKKKYFVSFEGVFVDENNPYYTSSKWGNLYSKDKKTLLFDINYQEFSNEIVDGEIVWIIPDYIENFAPADGIDSKMKLKFGKNIKKIIADIYVDSDGHLPTTENDIIIYGYEGTAAETWAKEQYATFVSLD